MRKLFTLLILVFLWTTGMTQEKKTAGTVSSGSYAPKSALQIHPLAPASQTVAQGSYFASPRDNRNGANLFEMVDNTTGIMALSGGVTCTTIGYIAGSTQILNFTLTFSSPDFEYIDGVSLTFPAGMVPQTSGTSNPLAPANGCTGVTINLNPISGQTVVWGQVTTPSDCGALSQGTYNFSVSVAIAPGLTGSQSISYYVMGDGYGGDPHSLSGTTSINAAVSVDVGVVSIAMGTYYNTGAVITPNAVVQNFGASAQTFNVNMTINNGVSNIYTDTKTVTSLAATASQIVAFNNWTTVAGNYTVTVTTTLAGDANAANNSQNKIFAVGAMPYPAMTGNASLLAYQSIDLASGARTNIGAIGSAPFPMAEEYNGVAVYRIYNDYSFGIVGPDGTFSSLGNLTGVTGTPTGLAWNWTTNTMYAVLLSATNLPQLCTINLNTLVLTLVGTGTEGLIIGMDFANDGYLYGPSLNPDNLYRIDPATGATTSMGPLGIDINFGQDVSFDLATNQLYTVSLTAAGISTFGTYSLTTGAFSGISDAAGNQHATFVITNEIPDCFAPTALVAANKTTTSADLSWTPGGSESGWLVEVGLPGFTPGNDEHIFKDSPVVNSVSVTGLSAGTRYQFFVQADCSGEPSAWSGGFFATNIECPGGAYVEAEVCGDSTNNACNNVLPENQTSEPITLGQTVCGTSFYTVGTGRDTDWYSFTLAIARQVTLTGKADFDLQLLFATSPCPTSVIAAGSSLAGVTASVSTQLGPGTYYAWVGPQFTSGFACGDDNQYYATLTGAPITSYCTPAPTSVDNLGITNVAFSTVNNTTGAEPGNYGDYSALIGDVTRTLTIPVSITYQTSYTYFTKIWIDWNNDFYFDVAEEVYSGESLADNPTTLAASFAVPADAPLGNHRMRIGGIDVGTITPCYSGSYGTFEDYTVNVIDLPATPVLSVTPASKDYGTVAIGSSSSQVFTISNTGGGTLTINPAVSVTGADAGQFILTDLNGYPVSLTTGQSITVSIVFSPATGGAKSANLNVVSNAGTTVVPLTGNGLVRPAGSTCDNPYPVTLPLVDYIDNTQAYGNDYLSSWVTPATSYLNGYDFVAQFNITEAGHLSGSVVGDWAGVIIVQDCPNPTTPAARLALGSGSLGGSFTGVLVQPGSYFAIVSTYPAPDYTDFTLNLSFTPLPACPVPTGLTATGMTTTTADLGWTELGTATSWDLEVIGFDETPTGIPTHSAVGSNPYTVMGLDASTHYKFYVRAKCVEDSDWSVAKDFYTSCGSFDLPYAENFDGVTAPAIPVCMSVTNNNADAIQWVTSSGSARSAPNAMRIGYNSSLAMDDWFFTSGLNLVPGTYNVSFWYRSSGSYPEALEVKWGSAPNAAGMTSAAIFDNNNIVNATYTEGTGEITITTAGVYYVGWHGYSDADMWYMLVDDISISTPPAFKTLNLTSVLLEGLYAGGGLLNEAYNELAPQFPGNADEITVELHNSADYSIIEHTAVVLLSLTGTATVSDIPAALSGDYYITVKHRNSIETTTADPVSFAGAVVNQSFANPTDVYGGNLLLMLDGGYAIYGGDVNQDGSVDGGDVTPFDNDQFNYVSGYVPTDINGDAIIDSGDGTIIDNNQFNYIGSSHP